MKMVLRVKATATQGIETLSQHQVVSLQGLCPQSEYHQANSSSAFFSPPFLYLSSQAVCPDKAFLAHHFFVFSSKCALSSNRNFSKLYSQPQRVKEGKVSQETPTPTSPTTQQKATIKDLCLKGSYPKASVNQILHAHGFSSIEYLPSHDKFIRRVTRTDCDKYAQIC